jgi:hypothetical protein
MRRKERVERRLHQMEVAASPPASALPPTTPPADALKDLAEFAKLYFNDHPRSPEGTTHHSRFIPKGVADRHT